MDPTKLTSFMGFEMEERSYSMLMDFFLASFVIFLIVVPGICFKVEGPSMRQKYY